MEMLEGGIMYEDEVVLRDVEWEECPVPVIVVVVVLVRV